jgi:hypothetical protein
MSVLLPTTTSSAPPPARPAPAVGGPGSTHVAIVGIGPRGLSVLERLCADGGPRPGSGRITVHVVDPHLPGAGSVWRTDQARELLMNTVAAQVTIFTDPSVSCDGPIVPGPSLYQWARHVSTEDAMNTLRLSESVRAEAAALGPDTYPSRSFYGQYLRWAFRRIVEAASPGVAVDYHALRAVALDDDPADTADMADTADPDRHAGPRQCLTLDDGSRITGLSAVVLAQGHTGERLSDEQEADRAFARRHDGLHLAPANPADVDLGGIRAGETVLVRGLGLTWFDYQTLLTSGRGGGFERDDDGRLRYRPSGREPRLLVGSRRGVPYHSRGANQKAPHERHEPVVVTAERIAALTERAARTGDVDFGADIWPLISLEVELTYYRRRLAGRLDPRRLDDLLACYAAALAPAERPGVLDAHGVPDDDRWRWDLLDRPYADRLFPHRYAFRSWLVRHLDADVAAAREGNVDGPVKAALDVLRDLRNEVRQIVDHGGVRGSSYAQDLQQWFTPFNAFLSIGPPLRRTEEMSALVRAGVIEPLGPGMTVARCERTGRFVASSSVPGPEERARVLIEARLPEVDVQRTTDPLMVHLLATGACRPYRIPDPLDGEEVEFGGITVTHAPYHLVDADGRAHPRRFAYGVPTETVHWASAAGIRPGVNSVTLSDSDAIAHAVVGLCTPEEVRPRVP